MCGIFALFTRNFQLSISSIYIDLINILDEAFMAGKNRGPEDSKIITSQEYVSSNPHHIKNNLWYLGFHRLAINGLNINGMQPFYKDGVFLICNGEIYNYRELYKEIGIVNQDEYGSDCQVILDYYIKFGIEYTISRLHGVFAFVILDATKNQMYIARDRVGIRSLYWTSGISKPAYQNKPYNLGETILVASELKQLTCAIRNDIKNPIFSYSNQLKPKHFPPGHFASINMGNGECILNKYWSPYEHVSYLTPNVSLTGLIDILYECVKRRVDSSQREVCCLLSGGLDSSLIASMVSRILTAQGKKVKTFSIGMKGSEDLRYARMVADFIHSDHTEVIVTNDEMFNAIPCVVQAIETYDTTSVRASVGNYLVCKYIKENCDAKVVFNGDGADEVMGGYLYFQAIKDQNTHSMERLRLLSEISSYDVLRSDKSIAGNGLEARTPYLDPEFIRAYFSVAATYHSNHMPKVEKELIRQALKSCEYWYLPIEVVNRRKEAFSDGVSGEQKSWKDEIEERINNQGIMNRVSVKKFMNESVQQMTPEQAYYKDLFSKSLLNLYNLHFYNLDEQFYERLETRWMPRYVKADDPSARTLDIYYSNP
jgi:asparagine synthase (glutamine-hydrolysing)